MTEDDKDISDTDRINAVESGLCVSAQDERTPAGWVRLWSAQFNAVEVKHAQSIREAIDLAIIASRQGLH